MSETTAAYQIKRNLKNKTRSNKAQTGIGYLEEAILETLGDRSLKAAHISNILGIPSYAEENEWNYAIVHGILRKLQDEGYVKRDTSLPGGYWIRKDTKE